MVDANYVMLQWCFIFYDGESNSDHAQKTWFTVQFSSVGWLSISSLIFDFKIISHWKKKFKLTFLI